MRTHPRGRRQIRDFGCDRGKTRDPEGHGYCPGRGHRVRRITGNTPPRSPQWSDGALHIGKDSSRLRWPLRWTSRKPGRAENPVTGEPRFTARVCRAGGLVRFIRRRSRLARRCSARIQEGGPSRQKGLGKGGSRTGSGRGSTLIRRQKWQGTGATWKPKCKVIVEAGRRCWPSRGPGNLAEGLRGFGRRPAGMRAAGGPRSLRRPQHPRRNWQLS